MRYVSFLHVLRRFYDDLRYRLRRLQSSYDDRWLTCGRTRSQDKYSLVNDPLRGVVDLAGREKNLETTQCIPFGYPLISGLWVTIIYVVLNLRD